MVSKWYDDGMRTTIDRAGRVVIPKSLRDELGLQTGEVEIVRDGAGVRIEPVAGRHVVERGGRVVIPEGDPISDDDVRDRRMSGRR